MTLEEMDKKIEFILEMQAQFAVNQARSEANIDGLRGSVVQLARVVRDSVKLSDDRFARTDNQLAQLTEAQKATDRTVKELAEIQKTSDERLNVLVNVVERHITGPDHAPRA